MRAQAGLPGTYPPLATHLGAALQLSNGVFIAVGPEGMILRSHDGGSSWSPVRSDTPNPLGHVVALPEHVLIAVRNGAIVRSIDDGDSWSPVYSPVPFAYKSLAA